MPDLIRHSFAPSEAGNEDANRPRIESGVTEMFKRCGTGAASLRRPLDQRMRQTRWRRSLRHTVLQTRCFLWKRRGRWLLWCLRALET